MSGFDTRCEIDGEPATAAQLAHIARFNHGHFTSLQVRDGGVRGLDLHLQRLRDATDVMYGALLDVEHVRELLRRAVRDVPAASVRINIYAPDWTIASMRPPARVGIMINVLPPASLETRPLRLRTVEHERFLPHIKHVATFALFELRARARRDGFDDALFFDRHDNISEGSIWNVAFRDGDTVVLPDSPQLDGIAMQLLQRGLHRHGIPVERRSIPRGALADFRGAFISNASAAGQPIASIDDVTYDVDAEFIQRIVACYEGNPLQPI